MKDAPEAKPAAATQAPTSAKSAAAKLSPLKRKLEAAEQTLTRCTDEVAGLDARLAEPGLYVKDPLGAKTLADRRARAATRLETAEAEWMAAAEAYEAVRVAAEGGSAIKG